MVSYDVKAWFEDTCPECGREEAIGVSSGTCRFCPYEVA